MTPTEVLEAITHLEAAGEPITVRAVQALTKGSMRDVAYYVREWREYRLLPKTDWERLEERVDDLRVRLTAHPGDARLPGYLKELTGLLLQVVRTMHNAEMRPQPVPRAPLRYATRKERSQHNREEWEEIRTIKRLLRARYG